MPTRLQRLLPDHPVARRLSVQSILYAFGDGTFVTGNAVYFTQIVGLSAAQVGLGLSLSGLVVLALSVPMGKVADRFGARRMWALGALLEALLYLCYPFIHGFPAFVTLLTAFSLVETVGNAGRGAYTIGIFPREERVRYQAFLRSALNLGFTLGALGGGLALASDSHGVIRMVPVLSALVLATNATLIWRLPDAREEAADADTALDPAPQEEPGASPKALKNRGFLASSVLSGIAGTHWILLLVVIPLWLVERTDAPHWVLAWLFGTNTVLAVLFQVPAARGMNTVSGALRGVRLATAFMVVSCCLVAITGDTIGWVSIVLLLVGHMTVTGAELFESAATWGFLAELSDPARRGEYQGVWGLGGRITNILGPAAYTWLALNHGTLGWVVIATTIVLAAALLHPAVRSAERFLATHSLDASRATA
ncbi:MAG: MFS transporter [Nocardioides sp.]